MADISYALRDIQSKYPNIQSYFLECFVPVYYPIAIVEVRMEQEVFENFDAIQQILLKLVSLGLSDSMMLSKTLGLSEYYVEKLIFLLTGYGHIANGSITELGRDSLKAGKKITMNRVQQKFQVDALNGTIIKLRQTVLENTLNSRENTFFKLAHMNYIDGITVESLKSQLCPEGGDSQSNPYLRRNNIAVNLNIRDVVNAQCTELKYAKCYMVKLRGIEDPIIFTKCFDFYAADVSERYVWKPVCISNNSVRTTLGFEAEIPLATSLAVEHIRNMYSLIVEHHASIQWENELIHQLQRLYPFRLDSVSLRLAVQTPNQPNRWMVEIDKDACPIYKPWLLILLNAIANKGECPDTTDLMYGGILCIRAKSSDTEILECAKAVKQAIDQHGERKLSTLLKNRISGNDNLFDQIHRLLSDDSLFADD